jgi:hypothetical protein
MTITVEQITVLTEEDKEVLRAQARGSWQLEVVNELIYASSRSPLYSDGFVMNPMYYLRGRARSYAGRYQQSFYSLLRRVRDAGYTVDQELGPKGGLWSARYRISS